MSESFISLDENQIRYVYGDQQYILARQEINQELTDLSCDEASKAILVDGQFVVAADNQTILLRDSDSNHLTQYYINCDNEGFIVDSGDNTTNTLFQATECLQLVEEDTDANESPQIIYYTNGDDSDPVEFVEPVEVEESEEVQQVQDEEGNVYPFKRIKLEGHFMNLDEFVQQQANLEGEDERKQFAILEDGTTISTETYAQPMAEKFPEAVVMSKFDETELIDLSKITGRNLITGQTVTLHSYMEKLKKRLTRTASSQKKSPKKTTDNVTIETTKSGDGETKKSEFSDLLDKRIAIGTTKSGKRIVGRIIHVEKKKNVTEGERNEAEEEVEEGEDTLVINDVKDIPKNINDVRDVNTNIPNCEDEEKEEEEMKILVKKSTVPIDSFDEISKTLGGVMELESVRKKLENKNIVVKLVEKRFVTASNSWVRSTYFSYGYMEQVVMLDNESSNSEKWKFVPDQETQEVLLGEHLGTSEEDGGVEKKSAKFPITTSLTILVTFKKGGSKNIRLNLNPAPGNLCTICVRYFKSNLHLRLHMHRAHNTYGSNICDVCDEMFESTEALHQHRSIHVQEGRLFVCSKCNKCFPTYGRLLKHLPNHDVALRPLECSVCKLRSASNWALKKHLLTHTGFKPYACEVCEKQFPTAYDMNFHKKIHFPEKHFACNVCLRTFSRHSNLLRHMEIHKGDGALFKCEVCCCSFNYISSLTRHMVQNHIEPAVGESRKNEPL